MGYSVTTRLAVARQLELDYLHDGRALSPTDGRHPTYVQTMDEFFVWTNMPSPRFGFSEPS